MFISYNKKILEILSENCPFFIFKKNISWNLLLLKNKN